MLERRQPAEPDPMTSVRSLLCVASLLASFGAHACGPSGNLVQNCSFDTGISGYSAQAGGDVISHEAVAGNLAPGAMRVRDTAIDSDSNAEAEACINLTAARSYRLEASFRALVADTCILGWDEFEGPDCTRSNGLFVASSAIAVNANSYTALATQQTATELAQSIELVLLCSIGTGEAEFLVDDVAVLPQTVLVFRNGFESP
jgi:hypothetical protein